MNEEEKKAIEIVKGLAVYYDDYSLLDEEEIEENESVNKSIELILNLIENLIAENKQLKAITNQYEAYECEASKDSRAKIIIADKLYFNNGYFKNNFIEIDKIKKVFEDLEKIIKAGEENVWSNIFNGRNHS